jgi:two-component system, NarL family, response regulator LiaR
MSQESTSVLEATPALTQREVEVLALLARGLQNKEIAAELAITERTAKFHICAIMSKLDASNRTEAVSVAAQLGLVKLQPRQSTGSAGTVP